MMLTLTRVLGHIDDPAFAGRQHDRVPVAWDEATKPRLRRTTELGRDVVLDLGRGQYLADDDVLHDDGDTVILIRRTEESALVVRFSPTSPPETLVADAVRLGHAFGNQHVPLEPDGTVVAIPLTTSAQIALRTFAALDLRAAEASIEPVRLGRRGPLGPKPSAGHSHGEPANPDGAGS